MVVVIRAIFLLFLIFVAVPKNAKATVEFVKTHHVKELLKSYMELDDHELRSILKPGFSLKHFRSAVNDLQSSFGALESKISPYFDIIKKPFSPLQAPFSTIYKVPKITYKKEEVFVEMDSSTPWRSKRH